MLLKAELFFFALSVKLLKKKSCEFFFRVSGTAWKGIIYKVRGFVSNIRLFSRINDQKGNEFLAGLCEQE